MNAKEKAEELVKKYEGLVFNGYKLKRNQAVQCAIICVEEILLSHYPDYEINKYQTYWHAYDFCLEVKQHLLIL